MTAEPFEQALPPHHELAARAAEAAAQVLPSADPLVAGDPQAGTEHVVGLFAAAACAELAGARSGLAMVLVGQELVDALAASPLGQLDVANAVQPALDAVATALGCSAQAAREVELDAVVATLGADFVAVPLIGAGIAGAVLIAESTLLGDPVATAPAGGQPLPGQAGQAGLAASVASGSGGPVPGSATLSAPASAALPVPGFGAAPDNVRTIVDGRRGIEMLHGVELEVTVELGRTRMPVRELLALTPGAVVALDRAAGSPADLLVNGRLIARGEVVVVDEDFGIRITEIVADGGVV